AIIKVGGIFLPLFSGYGAAAIASRLNDAKATALFTADGVRRRGKLVPMKQVADEAADLTPTLPRGMVHRHAGSAAPWTAPRDIGWHDLVARQSGVSETLVTGADEAMMLIYTSGTTGR